MITQTFWIPLEYDSLPTADEHGRYECPPLMIANAQLGIVYPEAVTWNAAEDCFMGVATGSPINFMPNLWTLWPKLNTTPPPAPKPFYPSDHPIAKTIGFAQLSEDDRLCLLGEIIAPPTIDYLRAEDWNALMMLYLFPKSHGTEGYRVMLMNVLTADHRTKLQLSGYSMQDVADGNVPGSPWTECYPVWNDRLGINWWTA